MARNPALQPSWPPLRQMTAQEREDFEKVISLAAGFREADAANRSLGERNDALELENARLRSQQPVLAEIAEERRGQIQREGRLPADDDAYGKGELALAAGCYALSASGAHGGMPCLVRFIWPWAMSWWKPKGARRDLVRAAALIVAEIERLDRAEQRSEDLAHG